MTVTDRARACISCRRILFPTPEGRPPPHKVPEQRTPKRPHYKNVPLTASDSPWCEGKVFA